MSAPLGVSSSQLLFSECHVEIRLWAFGDAGGELKCDAAHRYTKQSIREAAPHLLPEQRAEVGRPGRLPGGGSIQMGP